MKRYLSDGWAFGLIAMSFGAGVSSWLNLVSLNRGVDAGVTIILMMALLILPILINPDLNLWRRARLSQILFASLLCLLLATRFGVFPWLYNRLTLTLLCVTAVVVGAVELYFSQNSKN